MLRIWWGPSGTRPLTSGCASPPPAGLAHICQTYDRFSHVAITLGNMVINLEKEKSARLLKHVIRCYLRLSDNARWVRPVSPSVLLRLVSAGDVIRQQCCWFVPVLANLCIVVPPAAVSASQSEWHHKRHGNPEWCVECCLLSEFSPRSFDQYV